MGGGWVSVGCGAGGCVLVTWDAVVEEAVEVGAIAVEVRDAGSRIAGFCKDAPTPTATMNKPINKNDAAIAVHLLLITGPGFILCVVPPL